jgi:Uma2 family endonuclease
MAKSMMLPPETAAMPEKFFEIVNGQRVELPPMGAFETWVASILAEFLASYAKAHRLGRVTVEMLFRIDRETDLQRWPDLALVSYDRWPRNQPVPRTPAWDVVPDLAVEVVSSSNGANEVLTKVLDYFRTGVQLVWVVYPLLEQVHVYESATTIRVLQRGDTLDGGAVLPGFQNSLATWFEDETVPELYP